jgi:hypothetical protein
MRYAVRISDTGDYDSIVSVLSRAGTIYVEIPEIRTVGVELGDSEVAQLRGHPGIRSIDPERMVKPGYATPNDPSWSSMWFKDQLGLLDAWDISTGMGVQASVIDTGVYPSHVELQDKLSLPGYCAVTYTSDITTAGSNHGTATTSIFGAMGDNGVGLVGIARDTMVFPIRVSTVTDGTASDLVIARAIVYAVDRGIRVMSVSYEPMYLSPPVVDAVAYARRKHAVVCVGMTNDTGETTIPAANYRDMIIVGGYTSSLSRPYGYGTGLWLRSPVGMPAASGSGSSIVTFSGNSSATPVVAGVCALILAIRPDLGTYDIRQILAQSANRSLLSGASSEYSALDGWGTVNAYAALQLAQTWISANRESPVVIISSPDRYSIHHVDDPINVEVFTQDDVAVTKVELYKNGVLADTKLAPPFDFSISFDTANIHQLKAIAYDALNQETTSATSPVRVIDFPLVMENSVGYYVLNFLTEGATYEVRARAVTSTLASDWSEWEEFTIDPSAPVPLDAHYVERLVDTWRLQYAKPHVYQDLEYRFKGGAWTPITANPFTFPTLVGMGELEARTVTSLATGSAVSLGTFNFARIHYVIYPSALGAPSAAQVFAGQDSTGAAAISSGSEDMRLTDGLQSFANLATGLVSGDPYRIAFVGTDNNLVSNVAVSDAWTTLSDGTAIYLDSVLAWVLNTSATTSPSLQFTVLGSTAAEDEVSFTVMGDVAADNELDWVVLATAQQDLEAGWSILSSVSVEPTVQYSILAFIAADTTFQWSVLSAILRDSNLLWGVLSSVAESSALQYNILAEVAAELDARWDLAGTTGSSVSIPFSVLSQVAKAADAQWSILSLVDADTEVPYSVMGSAGADSELQYEVHSQVASDKDVAYQVLALAAKDTQVQYHLLDQVTSDAGIVYSILEGVGVDGEVLYSIYASVAGDTSITYKVLDGVYKDVITLWKALTSVGTSSDIQYSLLSQVASSKELFWACLDSVEVSTQFKWALLAHAVKDLELPWVIEALLGVVTKDSTLRYSINTVAVTDKQVSYSILSAVAQDSQISYQLLSSILKSSSIAWQVFGAVLNDTELLHRILAATYKDVESRFQILTSVDATQDILWDVLAQTATDIELTYAIEAALYGVVSDFSVRWRVLADVYRIFQLDHTVLANVNSSVSLNWNLLDSVSSELETQFRLYGVVLADVESSWEVYSSASNEVSLFWIVSGLSDEYVPRGVYLDQAKTASFVKQSRFLVTIRTEQDSVFVDVKPVIEM